MSISSRFSPTAKCVLYNKDCHQALVEIPNDSIDLTVTSPPYFMGKEYDRSSNIDDFIEEHKRLLPELLRITKDGGSICWQVGYHIKKGITTPLDMIVHGIFAASGELQLRNRIVWTYGHGLHGKRRFSGRHEMILWYTKGHNYHFDLDKIRVPQKYPGKRHYKGENKGSFSGHPLGKNPSDVWDIPNVKSKHIEKTEHPCQFPVALAQRLVRALVPENGRVLDPFMGSGTTGVAALIENKNFVGMEIESNYHRVAVERCEQALQDDVAYRPLEKPVLVPNGNLAVAQKPSSFQY